jgi:RimJ/RimL family protein N-acetyltransferase
MVAKQASYTLALSPPRHDWALITKRTNSGLNEIVGKITVIYPKKNAEEQRTELSYCINPNYAGRGLATEGSKLVLESLKEELVATAEKVPDLESRKREFVATVHPKNIPSQKVLEKLGFEKDPKRQAGDKPGATVERPRNYYLLIPKPSIENNSMRSGRYVVM